jgi:hypothetical protein
VVEKDKVSTSLARGCDKKPTFAASSLAQKLFLLWWVISTTFQRQALVFGDVKK